MARISKPPEERKQELIDVALKLFFTKGYAETSVRDILKEVKGCPGMFYYYFSSKEQIFKAALDQYVDQYIASLSGTILNQDLSVLERIKSSISQFSNAFANMSQFVTNQDSPFNSIFHSALSYKIISALKVPLSTLMKEAIDCGIIKMENIRTKTIEETAFYLTAGIYGIMNYAIYDVDTADYEKKPLLVVNYISALLGIDMSALM